MAPFHAVQSDDTPHEADRKQREETAQLVASSENKLRRIARDIYGVGAPPSSAPEAPLQQLGG
jgi:hypothetical protein